MLYSVSTFVSVLCSLQVEECAHLTSVLKEMSDTRAKAIQAKVLTLESYNRLQVRIMYSIHLYCGWYLVAGVV